VNRHLGALVLVAVLVVPALACANGNARVDPNEPGPTITLPAPGAAGGPEVSGSLTIFVTPEVKSAVDLLAKDFKKQNPDAVVTVAAEGSRETILRAIAHEDIGIIVADLPSILLLHAYVQNVPRTIPFARDAMIVITPKGNPAEVKSLADVEDSLPPEAICTPAYMRESSATPVQDAKVPVNEESPDGCRESTVRAVTEGGLKAAFVPGSAANLLFRLDIGIVHLPTVGNLFVPYGLVPLGGTEVATGFANYAASENGRAALRLSGYVA
jgi:molybdate transport system substrate-binding protein